MEVEINPKKSVEENAAHYYEKSKKYRKKTEGAEKAIEATRKKIEKEDDYQEKALQKKKTRRKGWFEKFHWTFIDDHLVIGGRDAKSNDIIVKKHLEKNDLFFHADVHGASAVVMKNAQDSSDEKVKQAAVFAACFSRAWSSGKGTADVYCVKPEQVKTAAKSGEYLAKGSFVIEGERKYYRNVVLELAVSFINEQLEIGPVDEIEIKNPSFVKIKPDLRLKKGESAKLILKKLKKLFPKELFDVNDVIQLIPNGGSRIY